MSTENTKLCELRLKKNLSQNKLAVITGISVRTLQCYEQKARPIDGASLDILCSLCLALDCKIEDLLENKDLRTKYKMVK